MIELYWCRNCGVPIVKNFCEKCRKRGIRVCTDLRPVFVEEASFIESETGMRLPVHSWEEGLWQRQNTLWWNGRRLLRLKRSLDRIEIERAFKHGKLADNVVRASRKVLYEANRTTIKNIEREACTFIRKVVRQNSDRVPVVSFSGGKDSTVVSYLVRRALKKKSIRHIFGDTTMEYPDTYKYLDDFAAANPVIPLLRASSRSDFFKMCELLGPPSRINAWCCSVFKSSPIAALMNTLNGSLGVISFEGIRRKESSRRRNRERLYNNKKIVHQLSAYPILEWKEFFVWIFLLTKKLTFNGAYNKGSTRVGCLFCPNNGRRNEQVLWKAYPIEMGRFREFVSLYAKRIGKDDPAEYYISGAWKMRVGKMDGKSLVYVRKAACLHNENAMHFMLDVPIEESFIERFKPFGKLQSFSDDKGDGFVATDAETGDALFILRRAKNAEELRKESKIDTSWDSGKEFLCVDILTQHRRKTLLESIERQIRKYQVCVSCEACAGVCPTGAISFNPHFRISDERCIRCGRCVSCKFVKAGCVSVNSQQQGRGFLSDHRI